MEEMRAGKLRDYDDKDLVIVAVFLLCLGVITIPGVSPEALAFLEKAMYGFFGMAVGRAMPPKAV